MSPSYKGKESRTNQKRVMFVEIDRLLMSLLGSRNLNVEKNFSIGGYVVINYERNFIAEETMEAK